MSWDLLKRFIESDHFNNNPFLPVSYLSRYADHVGIHYVLCQKLRQFSYEEIEFFLPQLCHLIISVDNESMALEEFIIDLCEESVNAALLTFWLFQTYLYDLSGNPQSTTFRTCRRVYNKVQHIVFGVAEQSRKEKLKDNVLPVTVLASFVLAGVAAPFLPRWAGPLAIAQGRKPRSTGETISDPGQTQKIQRSHTVAGGSSRPRKDRTARSASGPNGSKATRTTTGRPKSTRPPLVVRSSSSHSNDRNQAESERPSLAVLTSLEARVSTISLPDMATSKATSTPSTPALSGSLQRSLHSNSRKLSHHTRPLTPSILSPQQRIKFLRSHYFRSETQFLTALEDISNRLVIVPKPARLSALRAELALIAQDLPAEVDIPIICPATLRDGSPGQSVHHRIVRLNPAEATVLNSAEKVPYLLMVEVLRDDFDFDPETAQNSQLLSQILSEGASRRRIFDLSEAPQHALKERVSNTEADSVFEPAQGDLGSSPLIKSLENEGTLRGSLEPGSVVVGSSSAFHPPPLSSSTHTLSTKSSLGTPRTSDMSKRSTSPGPLRSTTLSQGRNQTIDQPDVSALATHMRTAAHMLAQLDTSGSKRPKDEVAAIRAKIIASMQSLEEQSFYGDETSNGPTFDAIMASTNNSHMIEEPDAMNDNADAPTDPGLANNAGAARMENDQKTGGVQRQGDRDDPSAATFGEAWETKRERIRKASPYGWMKNWDLLSVIVKTGADLRQEAFASQLIQVCWKIWEDAEVPVWVKKMRILVTGESSGLIETITNGVSLHSLKRSLTLATIEAGKNPRGRIATLRDHFIKAFGEVDSETYKAGEDAFLRSLAAYSMISYILQLKDRHNGNILIDSHGHIIHIDFGFMLSNSPGSVGFEAAPFKLTQDYVDVLGGIESPKFAEFKKLCKVAFQALRKSADSIIDLVDMMGKDSKMPCFNGGAAQTTASLRQRFQLHLSKDDAEQFVETDLIGKSLGSYYTRLYDTFQYRTQGIY